MRTHMLLGVFGLSLALASVPAGADARESHVWHARHGHAGLHLGFDVNVVRHYRPAPVYGYYDDGYGYWDGHSGYSTYYGSPYPYVDSYYVPAPRVVVRYDNTRRWWRPQRHLHFRHWR
jgi:hypothetical protein